MSKVLIAQSEDNLSSDRIIVYKLKSLKTKNRALSDEAEKGVQNMALKITIVICATLVMLALIDKRGNRK